MIEPTSLLKPWPKSTDLVRITCFVRNHVSWNTFWETLISTIIEWPQIFGKAVSTVLGSLNALDTRYHTRSGQRGIIKTTSHVEPELNKEDDDENFESGLHNQKHKFEQYKFSISRFTAQSKLFEGKKTEWKFICYVVLFLPFSPSLLFSCLLCNVDKTLPIWQMFIFHHSKKDSFTRVLSNICISYGQDFSSLRTTLAAEC